MSELFGARRGARVWGVAPLLAAVSEALGHAFGACTVRGEVSGFSRAPSGHCYFNLKDAEGGASLRCAMFRRAASLLDFAPANGQLLDLRGRMAVFEARGELQFIVESALRSGDGARFEQFLRLRARLEAEGLFDATRKRDLPRFPTRIGVVTSLAAAALHDIVSALARRSPHVEVIVYPSVVQGAEAPAALCAALALAASRREVDVLIVGRGGGSIEDLWAFNDEGVVRAIAELPMASISGVGHETDFTLADLAVDVRAPTPTAAAELAAPSRQLACDALDALADMSRSRVLGRLDSHAQRLDRAALRMSRPADALRSRSHALDLLASSMANSMARERTRRRAALAALHWRIDGASRQVRARAAVRIDRAADRLRALDPTRVLARGYSMLLDGEGHAITSIDRSGVGDTVHAIVHDGRLSARVTDVVRDKPLA